MKKNQKPLHRIDFDDLITDAFMDWFNEIGKYIPDSQLKKGGPDFCPLKTPNRNSEQVPNGLWKVLLMKHNKEYYYN